MTVTLVGQLLDEHGAAMQISRHVVPSSNLRSRSFDVETRRNFHASPARNVRVRQAEHIPVNIGHNKDATVGETVHLEMVGRHLWLVAELDHEIGPGPWKLSAETSSLYPRGSAVGEDILLTGAGIVARTAMLNLDPCTLVPGDVAAAAGRVVHQDGAVGQLIRNASEVLRDRRAHRPIRVRGLVDPEQEEQLHYAAASQEYYRSHPADRPPDNPGAIRYGPRGRIISVR